MRSRSPRRLLAFNGSCELNCAAGGLSHNLAAGMMLLELFEIERFAARGDASAEDDLPRGRPYSHEANRYRASVC